MGGDEIRILNNECSELTRDDCLYDIDKIRQKRSILEMVNTDSWGENGERESIAGSTNYNKITSNEIIEVDIT